MMASVPAGSKRKLKGCQADACSPFLMLVLTVSQTMAVS